MIVDSTALLERAVDDIVTSAFQSAGQRCSALRMLYVQEEIHDPLIEMLMGASKLLQVGDPIEAATDVGPLIDAEAQRNVEIHVDTARHRGALVWQGHAPQNGTYVAPSIIAVSGIEALREGMFGPVLHVATYRAGTETTSLIQSTIAATG
jgi:RHH-type transcriptional regulator, proline utilization regulon repressor / proline dehydrogenase / delta 1-pyrroline-5-carboxylate dehydrogenase